MINIEYKPTYADNYEYIVAREVGDKFYFYGAYDDNYKANKVAKEIDGIVFHNIKEG